MNRTTSEWTLWVVAASSAIHATEEYLTGWQSWARDSLGISMPIALFVVANATLVAVGVSLARVGWRRPTLSLVIPVATLANAILFHLLPTVVQGRRSPGVYSAALLYLPFSTWALVGAARDGVPRSAIAKAAIAGLGVALGVVMGARLLTS